MSVSLSHARVVNRQWLYPYYAIVFLLIVLFLFGCDSESGTAFSVTVQVEDAQDEPVEGATVGVRPCYDVGEGIACGADEVFGGGQSSARAKAVEVTEWSVRVEDGRALLTWTTASETNNAGFDVQRKVGEEETFEQVDFIEGQGTTADSTDYRYRDDGLGYATYTYRLIAVSISGNERVVGAPETIRRSIEPGIQPISPNPFRDQTTLRVRVDSRSRLQSTAYTLDGTVAQTIVQDSVDRGIRQFAWRVEDLPSGLYEQRTVLQTDDEPVARDTTYAVIARDATAAASLGTTGSDGTVSTRTRIRFPALYDVPAIKVRDPSGVVRGELTVSPTVEFVVTTENDVQTFRRTVAEGENTLTLSVSP